MYNKKKKLTKSTCTVYKVHLKKQILTLNVNSSDESSALVINVKFEGLITTDDL